MEVPSFLKLEGNTLVYNGKPNTEFNFYVPEIYFNDTTKNPIAQIIDQHVSMIGLCNWAIIDSNGKRGKLQPFRFPVMILCKPYEIEKAKLKLDYDSEETDYRILKFAIGDEVVSQTRVPQLMDNVELFFKIATITAKIPNTIPYDELWKLYIENMELSGNNYGLNAQIFGIITAELCRDPNDISKPFRLTNMKDKHAYKLISIKTHPKYVSPYTALISEGWDDAVRSAILLSDKDDEDIPHSPIEKIVTM